MAGHRQTATRRRTLFNHGIKGLAVAGVIATATWGFGDPQAAVNPGLRGILSEAVPLGLTDRDFEALDGNWEAWSKETAALVEQLYGDENLERPAQRELLSTLRRRLGTMQRSIADPRYRSLHDPLVRLHSRLQRRVDLAQAVLDTLDQDPHAGWHLRAEEAVVNVRAARNTLVAELEATPNGDAWFPVIRAEQLDEVTRPGADPRAGREVIATVHKRLADQSGLNEAQQAFLGRTAFRTLSSAANDYLTVIAAEPTDDSRQQLREQLAALVSAIEQWEETRSTAAAASARRAYSQVVALAPDGGARITDALRGHYFNFNLRLIASEGLLNRFIATEQTTAGEVVDHVLGADVRGNQTTSTRVSVDLRPSASGAQFNMVLNGVTSSLTAGYTHQATVYTQGNHAFVAQKPITFDGTRFATSPASIAVNPNNQTLGADTHYSGVPLIGGFARRVAVRTAEGRRPESEAVAIDRVQRRVLPEFNSGVETEFGRINSELERRMIAPLNEAGLWPDTVLTSSTETEFRYQSRLMLRDELGGGTTPPGVALPANGAVVHVHESLLNNGADRLGFAGQTMTDDEVRQKLAELGTKVLGRPVDLSPPPVEATEEEEDATPKVMVFAEDAPVRFRVDGGSIDLILRAGFRREGREDIPTQEITISLTARPEGDKIVVERGRISVAPVERPESAARQITFAGVIRSKFETMLPGRSLDRTLHLRRGPDETIPVTVRSVRMEGGWVTVVAE